LTTHLHLDLAIVLVAPLGPDHHAMRNLAIYLSALSVLSPPTSALRHGASQLRDVLAFPKYEVQFLNDLPLAESDARRCRSLGIEREEEWMGLRAPFVDGRRLGDGNEQIPSEVGNAHVGHDDAMDASSLLFR
jgi:hypothetical protein